MEGRRFSEIGHNSNQFPYTRFSEATRPNSDFKKKLLGGNLLFNMFCYYVKYSV